MAGPFPFEVLGSGRLAMGVGPTGPKVPIIVSPFSLPSLIYASV